MSTSPRCQRALLATGLLLWTAVAAGGAKWLHEYSFTPGDLGKGPERWPAGVALTRSTARATLVVAMHPGCPCSRATLVELDTILAQAGDRLEAKVIFAPVSTPGPVTESEHFLRARTLPRVSAIVDTDGTRLRAFGLLTSGETRMYRADGTLAFRGGITLARGHPGDNPGRQAVLAAVRAEEVCGDGGPCAQPVFGCALFNREKDS
jgi:hypothetical protein